MNFIRTPGGEYINLEHITCILEGIDGETKVLFIRDRAGNLLSFTGEDRKAILKFLDDETKDHGFIIDLARN